MTPKTPALALLLAGAALTACSGLRDRYTTDDPDQRLEACLEDIRQARAGTGPYDGAAYVERENARAQLDRLALHQPNHGPTLLAAASYAYEAGETEKARHYLDALLAREPGQPEAAALRARLVLEQGNLPQALRFLEDQIDLNPAHAGLRETYASALFLAERYPESGEALNVAERLGSPRWRVSYLRGLIAEKERRYDDARGFYERALGENADFDPARARLTALGN